MRGSKWTIIFPKIFPKIKKIFVVENNSDENVLQFQIIV